MKLILATRNRKKRLEMVQLLAPPWEPSILRERLQVETLEAYPDLPDVIEDAPSFAGNAAKKASETAQALAAWTVADDSGLSVDCLDGAPGVFSARYSGRHGDDAANNRKLLGAMQHVADPDRGAAFICALALADPTGAVRFETQAACRGRIIREERGGTGFGYDPLFLIPEYHRTFAELGPLVKHQLSHRARAFVRLRPVLERIVDGGGLAR